MQHIDLKIRDGIATLLLDRRHVANALSPGLIADLQQAFGDIHQEKRVRSVVLAGSGDHFCSGVDLRIFREIGNQDPSQGLGEWHHYWRSLADTIEQMLRFPKPVIAAVDGVAAGAGFALALAADVIVSSERACYTASASQCGLVGGATAALLHFRLGGSIAARLIHLAEQIDASEAYRIGLVARPVSADQVWVAACEAGRQCSTGPAESFAASKRLLNETFGESLFVHLAAAAAVSATACTTEAANEGIDAFLDKRPPAWP